MEKNNCIPCSVGILTYNSCKTLERCLESLRGFCEIVIADGGSIDATLDIAKKYDCTIITQSRQGHPIDDFSLERNRTLDAAAHDWFFYLDSDEMISPELKEEMRAICQAKEPAVFIYNVPYQLVSEDLRVKYWSFKTYYQPRFFNKRSGARFTRRVHEKIAFDEKKYAVGKVRGRWYVPLDVQLDFSVYREKVQHRIGIMASAWEPAGFSDFFKRALREPLKNTAKQLIRMTYLSLRYRRREIVPLRYEIFRLYSQYVAMKKFTERYVRYVRKK
ncbi:glycosyltransferase [Candidatus Azambacteria bacterium]|nr:glycosyltransferase [Candidatus Azambacteria bacterium]